jgi:hypothetical protein
MVQKLSATARAVTLTALALLAAALPAHADERPVVIRLYDLATGDAESRAAAMRGVAAMLADAGVTVDWRDCSRGGDAHPCRTVRGAHDLVVRIMPAFVARASGDAAKEPAGEGDLQLGFAAVDPTGQINVMATIYYDRVLHVARRAGLDASDLLGRAMAHEIGHLLLRVPGHNRSGLMRAIWTDAELAQNRRDDWSFTDLERLQLQAAARQTDATDDRRPPWQIGLARTGSER